MEATKETTISISITEAEATTLATFLASEGRRRRIEFERTEIMQCWDCLQVCEELLEALQGQGIKELESHHA